jgi:hypothetical protein
MNQPPGPVCRNYQFVIHYRDIKRVSECRDEVMARLRSGIPMRVAHEGLPISKAAVEKIAQRIGITKADEDPLLSIVGMHHVTPYDIYQMYEGDKMSVYAISKAVRSSPLTIVKVLKRMGADMRPKKERFPKPPKAPRYSITEYNKRAAHLSNDLNRYIGLKRWRDKMGKRYLPVYESVRGGMNMADAAELHKMRVNSCGNQFFRLQRLYYAYLDYGRRSRFKLRIPAPRLKQYEYVAKQSGISVLDWMRDTLSAAADKLDDRYDRNKPDRKSVRFNKSKSPDPET